MAELIAVSNNDEAAIFDVVVEINNDVIHSTVKIDECFPGIDCYTFGRALDLLEFSQRHMLKYYMKSFFYGASLELPLTLDLEIGDHLPT